MQSGNDLIAISEIVDYLHQHLFIELLVSMCVSEILRDLGLGFWN